MPCFRFSSLKLNFYLLVCSKDRAYKKKEKFSVYYNQGNSELIAILSLHYSTWSKLLLKNVSLDEWKKGVKNIFFSTLEIKTQEKEKVN